MPRRKVHREFTNAEKIERRKKRLAVWESEIRGYHAQIADLHDKIVNAERQRAEARQELAELEAQGSVEATK